jgi:eukaryotic-like serine/threonine-protein kinase
MVTFKCIHCGQQVEASDCVRGAAIRCARCGNILTPNPRSSAPITEIGDVPILQSNSDEHLAPPNVDLAKVSTDQSCDGETLIPQAKKPVDPSFAFLAPAQEPGELGRLAHYRVVRLFGQGGMGVVFEAFDTDLQRPVVLKVMRPELAQDDVARQRFLREARAMAAVNSDYVITVHQVGMHNNVPFLATEFLPGEPLDRWLERTSRPKIEEILRLGIEIARGLMAAHERGLIHRDIKPANIFLENIGSKEQPAFRVKLLDFGLARITRDRTAITNPGLVMGTPAYMAPEQVEGKAVDARCDLFSLGCLLYEMSTGAQPFTGESSVAVLMAVATKHPRPPRELNPELPPPVAKLILRLLAKNPKDRPASAHEVVETLETIAHKLGVSTITPPSGSNPVHDWTETARAAPRRRFVGVAIVLMCGLLIAGAFAAWLIASRWQDGHPTKAAPVPGAAGQGVSDTKIVFGMTGPFTGPARELGRNMKTGITTYFEYINERGGVAGRKLKLIDLDDGYDPDRALANMRELDEEHKVFAVIGNVGTATAVKTLPYALDKKMLFFTPLCGANFLRKDPPDRYVFNYRASYEEETAALVKYLLDIRSLRAEQIAVFAQNDAFGDDGYAGVTRALHANSHDHKSILRVGYPRNTLHVNDAVQKILQHAEIRAIVMIAGYKPAAAFLRKVKDARPGMIFASVSSVGSEAFAEALLDVEQGEQYAKGVIATEVVPPVDSGATLVIKYREQLRKYFPSERPSFTSLEGYIDAALLVEALKRTGANLTTETLIDALESLRNFDLGTGAPITLGASEHQASHKVWGTILDQNGHFELLPLRQ